MAKLLPGTPLADEVLAACAGRVARLKEAGIEPKLALVVAGDDPASHTYVARKRAACARVGIASQLIHLAATAAQAELGATLAKLNADASVHGVLLQLPLPAPLDAAPLLRAIDPAKDVDGLHPGNLGLLAAGGAAQPIACTPSGIMLLLQRAQIALAGAAAVVIGRSRIVGRPLALLLANASATVTLCHSQTRELAAHCRQADILVAACRVPKLVTGDMVRPGACVIDVGISQRVGGGIVGDVDAETVAPVAGHLTPVPGGVGPLTVAMLMQNTCMLAERRAG